MEFWIVIGALVLLLLGIGFIGGRRRGDGVRSHRESTDHDAAWHTARGHNHWGNPPGPLP